VSASGMTLLVADADPAVRLALQRLLERSGYRVCLAADGEQALAGLRRARPAMALLDTDMSPCGALEVLAEAGRLGILGDTRVVLLTARFRRSEWEEASRCGAEAMLSKPISPADLLGRIQEWTQTAPTRAAGEAPAAAMRAPDPEV